MRTIKSNNKALFVGPSPASADHTATIVQIHNLQNFNFDTSTSRESVQIFGSLAPVSREMTEGMTVDISFSYLLTNVINESNLGLTVDGVTSAISSLLDKTEDEKNYFLMVADEGVDAVGESPADAMVIGFGNVYLSSFSIQAALGDFASVDVSGQGINMRSYADGVDEALPALVPATNQYVVGNFTLPTPAASSNAAQPAILKPGDITVDLSAVTDLFLQDVADVCPQSFTISFDLNRTPKGCLGAHNPTDRPIQPPVDVTLSMEFIASDIPTDIDLQPYFCQDFVSDITITLKEPDCSNAGDTAAEFILKNMRFDTQGYNGDLGSDDTISVTWTGQVGAANDTDNGLFISGKTVYA